jgi:hypothetical protein
LKPITGKITKVAKVGKILENAADPEVANLLTI